MSDDHILEEKRNLRRKAEKAYAHRVKGTGAAPTGDREKLLHDLGVHEIELEMQNEELRRARSDLEASHARYVDLYDYAPVGYLTLNEKGLVAELNLTAAGLLGTERRLVLNTSLTHFIHPKSQDAFYHHRRKLLENPGTRICELVLQRKDGSLFSAQLESIGVEILGAPAVRSILTDVSERIRMEKEIEQHRRAEHAQLASFTELNPNPVVEADLLGSILYLNPAAEKLFPDLKAAGPSHPWMADLGSIMGRFRERAKSIQRKVRVGESWYGQTIHYVAESTRIRMYGVDITERIHAAELLQEYEKAVEGSDDMIASVDREYRYRMANAAFLKYRGLRKEEVIGRSVGEILGRDVFEQVVKENLDACFRGEVVRYEMTHSYPVLGERELSVSYMPIRGPEGIDRVSTITKDITERKGTEDAPVRVRKRFEDGIRERARNVRRVLEDSGKGEVDVSASSLTARETEVLTLVAEGKSSKEIADQLLISVQTVDSHRSKIKNKLKTHTVADLVRYAISHGLVVR